MSGTSWVLWLAASVAGAAFALWMYRRRETPGRGRGVLAALRAATIALLLLLVFDPELPGATRMGPADVVIIDVSLSMRLRGDGATLWETAVSQARRSGATEATTFGDVTRTIPLDSLAAMTPSATQSRLLPAVQAVAEAGRRRVTVITDGAIEDADEVARWLPRLGIDVEMQLVPGDAPNRGLVRIDAPSFVAAGDPVSIQFDLRASGTASGPVTVVAREGSTELARTVVETPAIGRVSTGSLDFTARAAPPGGYARYDIVIEADDATADDDTRSIYVNVTDDPAGAVLVSFRPDWEPRFLLPVLERSLGVPVRGYLRSGTRWMTLGTGMGVGDSADDATVERAVRRAEMLVLHGFGPAAPAWAREAAESSRRLLVLPVGDGVIPGLPLSSTSPLAGDWYLSPDVPASPVARLFAGIDVSDVPPLQTLRTPGRVEGAWAPAVASRGRRGASQPVALGGTTDGRRWVVALAQGYWRWAFWSEDARDVYERLWSALGGWVLGDVVATGPDAVAPVSRTIARDAQPAWVAYGMAPDSLRVMLSDSTGAATADTLVLGNAADTLRSRALPPGRYTYDVFAWDGDAAVSGTGEITVESYSPEFTRPPVEASGIDGAPGALRDAARDTRPLHATVWPYAVLLVLLSLEWVLRRKWGLR
jgi:hypothetical protein